MFPSASKQQKISYINFHQQQQRQKPNKSAYLPYFKRFPHNRFLSEQRKRNKDSFDQLSPTYKKVQGNFFNQKTNPITIQKVDDKIGINRQKYSSSIINRRVSKIKPRLFRQIYQRQSTKIRNRTQQTPDLAFSIGNISHSKSPKHTTVLTGTRVLQIQSKQLTLLQTNQITAYNEIYYYGKNCLQKKQTLKQLNKEDGSYAWIKGDHIAYRYQIIDQLGQGSFGQVFKCYDHKRRIYCAVKMVKDNQKFTKQARTEIKILNFIKSKDPMCSKNCIEIKDFFMFRSRMCIVFDLLSMNLYQLTKSNDYYGFPLDLIRRFALQILNAVFFLHKNKLIHADLKPQNILLKEANKSGLKIIDFGSSCFQSQTIYTYIQSRYYRAPEVILGLPYNRKIDVWSFGCVIAELFLGYPLFAGEDQHQQMCYIIEVLGLPPKSLSYNAKRWGVFFDFNHQLKPHQKNTLPGSKTLKQVLNSPQDDFVKFIRSCLQWDADKRIETLELLKSDWILKGLPEEIKNQHLSFIKEQQNIILEMQYQNKKNKKVTFAIKERNRLI